MIVGGWLGKVEVVKGMLNGIPAIYALIQGADVAVQK
jgi:hypothetical protein